MSVLTDLVPEEKKITVNEKYLNLLERSGQTLEYRKMKAIIAGYPFITIDQVNAFLLKKIDEEQKFKGIERTTLKIDGDANGIIASYFSPVTLYNVEYRFKLAYTPIEKWQKLIPERQLEKICQAKESEIFDKIYVLKYEYTNKPLPDPIAAGQIYGVRGPFFICQWDNDLVLDDLL